MANIKDLLQDDLVIEDIKAVDKAGVIREFAAHLKETGKITDEEELVKVLTDRESLGSTGIGDGIAIPHGKLDYIEGMIVAFGRSSRGVDFHSMDRKPAHLSF
jgi:PTS system nitrogen regulatory IIA component